MNKNILKMIMKHSKTNADTFHQVLFSFRHKSIIYCSVFDGWSYGSQAYSSLKNDHPLRAYSFLRFDATSLCLDDPFERVKIFIWRQDALSSCDSVVIALPQKEIKRWWLVEDE